MFRSESDSDSDSFSDDDDRENAMLTAETECDVDGDFSTVSVAHRSLDGSKQILLQQQKQRGIGELTINRYIFIPPEYPDGLRNIVYFSASALASCNISV